MANRPRQSYLQDVANARVLDMRWGVFTVTTMSRRARLPMDASRALDSRTAIPTVTGTTATRVAMIFSAKTDSLPVKPLRNKGTPTAAVIATHTRTSNQSTSQAARRLHGCRFTIASLSAVRTGASRKPNVIRDGCNVPTVIPPAEHRPDGINCQWRWSPWQRGMLS